MEVLTEYLGINIHFIGQNFYYFFLSLLQQRFYPILFDWLVVVDHREGKLVETNATEPCPG